MSPSGTEALTAAQRELARLSTALEGLDVLLEAAGDPAGAGLDAWIRADRGVKAVERVGIYTHAYFARIHAALGEDYCALRAALGEAAFHDLAKLYLMAHPPSSFSLRFAGERLAGFLAGPVAEPFRQRWPYAADLAAFEWALVDAFDAADSPPVDRDALSGFRPEEWGGLRFTLAQATQRLLLAWPVQVLRLACDRLEPMPAIAPAPTVLLVYRRQEQVFHRELSAFEAAALEEVVAGGDFADVCARIEAETSGAEAPGIAAALLERWLADGLVSALSL